MTALSDAGIISQVPVGRITLMSTGRTAIVSCGRYGEIEFRHTERGPDQISPGLVYDEACRHWRAVPELAIRDLSDIAWLAQHNVAVSQSLIELKAADRRRSVPTIVDPVADRITAAAGDHISFVGEIERFLPPCELRAAVVEPRYWECLMRLVPTLVGRG